MTDVWVVDSGPFILLAKTGQLSLLTALAREVLLPNQVIREVRAGAITDPARQALDTGFGTRVAVNYIPVALRSQITLGIGEKAVLALAKKRGDCTVVLDDATARSVAKIHSIPMIGTLGILVRAKKQGHLAEIRPVLDALVAAGL